MELKDELTRRGLDVVTKRRDGILGTEIVAWFYDEEITTHNHRIEREYEVCQYATEADAVVGHNKTVADLRGGMLVRDVLKRYRALVKV